MASQSPAPRLFTQPFIQAQTKKNIKAPRHWLCPGNSLLTIEFPAEMAGNAENVSIWWRHHDTQIIVRRLRIGCMAGLCMEMAAGCYKEGYVPYRQDGGGGVSTATRAPA